MWQNYLKVALRTMRRNKGYAAINILSLATGIACCLLIGLYVQDELSYDRFHAKSDRIYRLNKVVTPTGGSTERHAVTSGQMGPAMTRDFPDVQQAVRVLPWFDEMLMTHGETALKVPDAVFADSNFFDVFDFELRRGDPNTALAAPRSVVLTPATARKLYGDTDPVGQTLTALGDLEYTVTGIAGEAPSNSHLQYDALISWSTTVPGNGALEYHWMNNWLTQSLYTYLLLPPDPEAGALEAKFPAFMQRHFAERSDQYHLYLQPLMDVYLGSSQILHGRVRQGTRTYVYAFAVVALLILLIACFNFMNLSTARAARRAQEVGVRKVLGASGPQLARQFLGESMLLTMMALVLGAMLVEVALPAFSTFAGKTFAFDVLHSPLLLGGLAGLALVVGFISGSYPALVLSRFRPERALEGAWKGDQRGTAPRRVLVTVQFAITVALIAGTAIVYQQMQYVQTKNMGFQKDQIVVLPIQNTVMSGRSYEPFKRALLEHPDIAHATGTQSVPAEGTMSYTIRPDGKSEDESWDAPVFPVDYDFLDTYNATMQAGRFFSEERATDSTHSVIVNETLAQRLGWQHPVGKRLDIEGEVDDGRVIGVISDFNLKSLHHAVDPLVLYVKPQQTAHLSVRLTGEGIPAAIDFMRERWNAFESKYPFDYYFLDQAFAQTYRAERRFMHTLGLFSILAIMIACLGLFGLATLMAERRTKEIGVRKVLGASVAGLVALLSKEVVRLVVVAFVVAAPVTYLLVQRWLEGFAYRVDISGWVFLMAGLAALLTALLTVSYQAVRAALADPVESLRYE